MTESKLVNDDSLLAGGKTSLVVDPAKAEATVAVALTIRLLKKGEAWVC